MSLRRHSLIEPVTDQQLPIKLAICSCTVVALWHITEVMADMVSRNLALIQEAQLSQRYMKWAAFRNVRQSPARLKKEA